MDTRKIGGGLLIAVSVAVPLVVQSMSLSISRNLGFFGLFLCGIALIVGIAIIFREQNRIDAEGHFIRQSLQEIYSSLSTRLTKVATADTEMEFVSELFEYNIYSQEYANWVSLNLGETAMHRFLKPAGVRQEYPWKASTEPDLLDTRNALIDTLKARLDAIEFFMSENHKGVTR